jgi:nitrate reductase cytochrome c-type subunit
MEIQSAFNAGVQGFQKATASANQAAADIVKASSSNQRTEETSESSAQQSRAEESTELRANQNEKTPSLSESVVNLRVSEFQAKASAKVIQSADQALGSLVDVKV